MNNVKRCFRFFTLFDYDKEEKWLNEMNKKGWKLRKGGLCFVFDKCEPEDVVYKLDFQKNDIDKNGYLKMYEDYGWEYVYSFNNYMYFRKNADNISDSEDSNELDIFSDNESKLDMMKKIIKWKLLPILCIFLALVIPNFIKGIDAALNDSFGNSLFIAWSITLLLYLFIFTKCYIGYTRNKKRIEG